MKLTNKSEYALLALIYLARRYNQELVHADQIAEAQAIPKRFLQQILYALKRARYVKSSKGQAGGYGLSIPPEKVSIAEIVRLFEGAIAPTGSASEHYYESTPIEKEKKILELFREVRVLVAKKLESTMLSDVM